MGRIRTIKPEFFKHDGLYDLEQETGLPVRIAFAGIWTQCDREGQFRWRPRSLKTDVLPYDDVDFSRVLDALATRAFVIPYEVDGEMYGFVPSWQRHQVINNREAKSDLPQPPKDIEKTHASGTRQARVNGASQQLPRGKEGEGKGKEYTATAAAESPSSARDADAAAVDPVEIIREFDDSRAEHFGEERRRPWPHQADRVIAKRWIEAGADRDLCLGVFEACHARMAANGDDPPGTLKYHDAAVRDALREAAAEPSGNGAAGGATTREDEAVIARIQRISATMTEDEHRAWREMTKAQKSEFLDRKRAELGEV